MLKRVLLPLLAITAVAACGKQETQPASPAASEPAAPSEPAATAQTSDAPEQAPDAAPAASASGGEPVYKQTCFLCHGTGAGGAPMVTDKAEWEPRLAQGKDTLYKHALEGFTGSKGMMPAKGGNPSLTDDQVKSAVDYMGSQAQ
ncbi:MAG TPA: c-type cytochrome [Steroidobacter sp.]|jgi:cytochrome c5|nr:c-type cytochrome [Steroidobacter sp.]